MTRRLAGAFVLLVALAHGSAPGAETVTIGGVQLPADCPLARREHPRLLFTKADIPRLRERLRHPRIARELVRAKGLAAEGKAGAILLGVLYHLTGERQYLEQAKAKLKPTWIQTYPLAADLVMAAMTPEEEKAEADRMVAVVRKERWRPHVVHDLAAWGHGHDEFLDGDLKKRFRSDMVNGIEYNNVWSQGRGGSSMSHGYYGEHFFSEWFTMAVAWTNATGQDWVGRCDFAAHTPEYYVYHYRPWRREPSTVHIGVNAMCSHWQACTPQKFEGENLAVLAASTFRDGLGQWWVDEVISKISMGWGNRAKGHGGAWGKLLWYDPELPPVEPRMLPPARLFPENGHAVMRSDWTSEATYALFRCGRYGEIDGMWGRNNADNLHFVIGKKGILAADTGAVHSLNNRALGFAGTVHMSEYARQTVAHNSITVGRDAVVHRGWKDRHLGTVRRGGQSPIQDKSWWKLWGINEPGRGARPFREGRIVAYETSPLFDYAAGDATHSYPPASVRSISRQFIYLRPDAFVVFDRVDCARPGLETTWLLHALYEPSWDGRKEPDSSLPPEKQLVTVGGKTAPNPEPGGRFLHTDGDTFIIDDKWPGMTGRLFAKILLPEERARTVRTIGGAWHDFEVDGVNYGPTEETYAKHRGARSGHNRENTIGVEGWRIEISPKGSPASANFLAVLFATDRSVRRMPSAEFVKKGGRVGAKVKVGGSLYEVTFSRSGPPGGHITITEAGKKVLDRPLAAGVEDDYRKWSGDPRYGTWMARPEYRNFIGAAEVEAYGR